jgi:arylsulfatase A-like enzyme
MSILSRRSFVRTTALGSVGLALKSQSKAQSAKLPRKPNLVVFLPDQHRNDTLACYGAPHVYAPNLDKFASQSVVFQQAFVTQPLCVPSRSSLMTGTWPHMNGCTRNGIRLAPQFRCLPELIGDRDYRFAYMGKWHLGKEREAQHGFSDWVSIDNKDESDYGKFLTSKGFKPDNKSYFTDEFASRLPLEVSKPKFLETKACEFLDRHKNEPFVLFVAFLEPHPPFNGPLNNEHPLDQIDLDPTWNHMFGDDMPLRYRLRQEFDMKLYGSSRDDYLKLKQKYLGLVTEMDRSVGAVLSKLENLGLAQNTIVMHTSDHGEMMGAHHLIQKEVFFQESARVPYIVRMPNQQRSLSVSQPISHIDFAPTIVDLLGSAPNPQCVGKSRAPLLRGESMPPETVFVEWAPADKTKVVEGTKLATPEEIQRAVNESSRCAISPDGWKLCLRTSDKNELYNLKSDPGEVRNLYDHADAKEMQARLIAETHKWQESVHDTIRI